MTPATPPPGLSLAQQRARAARAIIQRRREAATRAALMASLTVLPPATR